MRWQSTTYRIKLILCFMTITIVVLIAVGKARSLAVSLDAKPLIENA
jgi:hypothetical protein